jgi:hypothetical protein
MATFQIQAITVNDPVTGRDLDLKMETLPGMRSMQKQGKAAWRKTA